MRTDLEDCSKPVQQLFSALDVLLTKRGLTPSKVVGGVYYKLGRSSLCRVDFKREFLRVQVGPRYQALAPPELRGSYLQAGWLVVRPDHAELAQRHLERCIDERLGEHQRTAT